MLTPRERCIRSVLLEEPDRIPLSLNIRPEPYERLRKALSVKEGEEGYARVCKLLGIDIIGAGLQLEGGYLPKHAEQVEGPYGPAYKVGIKDGFEGRKDIWGVQSIWAPGHTYTFTYIDHPLQTISIEDYAWPEIDKASLEHVIKSRKEHENLCVRGGVAHLWEMAWQLTGFNQTIKMMFTRPDYIDRVLDGLHKIRMQEASLLCEAGVDILNPVQPECTDPVKLKKLYGQSLCFDGTIGVQSTLPFGKPDDVAQEVKDRISTLGPTGLILGPTHAMQPDVPIENILTMYKTARKYGWNSRRL